MAATAANKTNGAYLEVNDLQVRFSTEDGVVRAVDGVSFKVERGQTLGIVGESGSGKSVTSLAIMGLHNRKRTEMSGEILVGGRNVAKMSEEQVRRLRGRDMAMIFQDPLSALHPFYTIGRQIVEAYRIHHSVSKAEAKKKAIQMLDRVGIPQPQKRIDQYPHEFSGGMRQRAMIAMSLINDPDLLIADEPTTALDVTVQAQILDLLEDLQREFNSAVIVITHDLGVVSQIADDVLVMYAGRVAEYGSAEQVLKAAAAPVRLGSARERAVPARRRRTGPAADPGQPAQPHQRAAGLSVPSPVSLRDAQPGPVRHRGAGAAAAAAQPRARPPGGVPPSGGGAPQGLRGGHCVGWSGDVMGGETSALTVTAVARKG